MKTTSPRAALQHVLTRSRLLPPQPGRPSGKVFKISDLPEFATLGRTLAREPEAVLPTLRERGQRICDRIAQQVAIPARDFHAVRLEGARVFGPSVMVVTAAATVICEVSKEWGVFLKQPEASWIQRRFFLPKPMRLPGRTLLLASTGAETFNHWMMESLPRLALAEKAGIGIREIDHWLVSRKSPPFVRESLEKIGVPWDRVVDFSENQHWVCDSLDLVSLASDWGMPSDLAVEFLQKSFSSKKGDSPKKVYLQRGKARDRQVEDEASLMIALAQQGFESLDCGSLGILQTAAALSRAEWIVAPHGAALTNMVFAPAGSRILEIFNPSFTNPCYRMLSARCRHKYACWYGDPTKTSANATAEARGNIVLKFSEIQRVISEFDDRAQS